MPKPFIDARVPVVFGAAEDAGPDDLVLRADHLPPEAGHPAGCACCVPRGPLARELGRLFMARAKGEVLFFRRVLIVSSDPGDARAALTGDALVEAWFVIARLDGAQHSA